MQPAGWPRMDCPHVGVPCLLAVPCSPQARRCGTQGTCESPWVSHAHPDVLHPPLPRPPWTWRGGTHKIWKFPVPTPTSPILTAPPGLVLQYPEDTNVPLVSHRCPLGVPSLPDSPRQRHIHPGAGISAPVGNGGFVSTQMSPVLIAPCPPGVIHPGDVEVPLMSHLHSDVPRPAGDMETTVPALLSPVPGLCHILRGTGTTAP